MADRTVAVRLLAKVDSYKRDMADASKATRKFGTDAAASLKSTSTQLATVRTESTLVGAAMLAGAGAAVLASARFDKAMSNVAAVSNASADEMGRLRQAAIDAGQATVFSASEAAQAEAELAKAGVKTADILGGALTGSLNLASAGGLDLADSATIAAQAMNIFNLSGRDVGHIADVLAAGANKSAADVGQLGLALRQGGLLAKQTGLNLEDTTGVLALFADNALIGSDAGTSLKTMLMRLTPQSDAAASTMDALGIGAYDAQGKFIGLEKWAGKLQSGMKDLTPEARNAALGIVFGSDAARAAGIIYDAGAKGVHEYTKAVDDQGAASRMAAIQLDNLAGDYEQLSGSIETMFIKSGSGANQLLREMTQAATGAVNFIGELPGPILTAGVAATTMGGAFFIAAPRIAAFNASLKATPGLARTASAALGAIAPLVAVGMMAELGFAIKDANDEADAFAAGYGKLRDELNKDISTSGVDDLYQRIKELESAISNPTFSDTLARGAYAINNAVADMFGGAGRSDSPMERELQTLKDMQDQYGKVGDVVHTLAYQLGVDFPRALQLVDESGIALTGTQAEMVAGVREYISSTQAGGAASVKAADGMTSLADATISAQDELKSLQDVWDATIGLMLGVSDAQIGAEKALDSLVAGIKKNGNAWDINTKAGQDNMSAWNDLVDAAGRVRAKKLEEGASVDQANEAYRKYLERVKAAPGLTDAERAAVGRLIDKYSALPPTKTTKVLADTSQAMAALGRLSAYYASLGAYQPGGSLYDSQVPKAASTTTAPKLSTAPAPSGGGSTSTSSLSVGSITVTAAPGETAAESLPRALRRTAFELSMGG